jgi:hypothetical protein
VLSFSELWSTAEWNNYALFLISTLVTNKLFASVDDKVVVAQAVKTCGERMPTPLAT